MPKIVSLVGIKHSGKSSIAKQVAKILNFDFVDTDTLILENIKNDYDSIRKFYQAETKEAFIASEYNLLKTFLEENDTKDLVIATGGGICDNDAALNLLKEKSVIIYLYVEESILLNRILKNGLPPFLDSSDPKKSFSELYLQRDSQYRQVCDFMVVLPDCNSVMTNSINVTNLLTDLAKRGKIWVQTPLEQLSK